MRYYTVIKISEETISFNDLFKNKWGNQIFFFKNLQYIVSSEKVR